MAGLRWLLSGWILFAVLAVAVGPIPAEAARLDRQAERRPDDAQRRARPGQAHARAHRLSQ